jgi:hypothetical protein
MANSGEQCATAARCRGEEEEAKRPGRGGVRSGFITACCFREEREGERSRAMPRMAGDAGVLDGAAWQLLGIGGPTWNGEGMTADGARAVGGRRERCLGAMRAAQGCTVAACAAAMARCCTGGRGLTGRRRMAWRSEEKPTRGR